MVQVMVWEKTMKITELDKNIMNEMRDRRDSYTRDRDAAEYGMHGEDKREFKRREMEHELGHERNNYAVAIDGRTWKVFADKNHAQAVARSLQNKGKKASVHETGADPTNESVKESTAGATTTAMIGTVPNPHISPGKARGNKSYTGTPGKSGTKAPPQPKVVQPKGPGGVAKNGLDIKSASLFGGPTNEAAVIKRR